MQCIHRRGGIEAFLEGNHDERPQAVEVEIVDHPPIGIAAPRAGDHLRQEKTRDEEEFGHAEGGGEPDDIVQEAGLAGVFAGVVGRVHHDHQDDRQALGHVHPGHPLRFAQHSLLAAAKGILHPRPLAERCCNFHTGCGQAGPSRAPSGSNLGEPIVVAITRPDADGKLPASRRRRPHQGRRRARAGRARLR